MPLCARTVIAPVAALAVGLLPILVAAPARAAVVVDYFSVEKSAVYNLTADGDAVNVRCVDDALLPAPDPAVSCDQVELLTVIAGSDAQTVELDELTEARIPTLRATAIDVRDDSVDTAGDVVRGSWASDIVLADARDRIETGPGGDVVTGGDQIDTGAGDDVIEDASGGDGIDAGPGDDRIVDSLGTGGLDGGTGEDELLLDLGSTPPGLDYDLTFTGAQLLVGLSTGEDGAYFLANIERVTVTLPREGAQRIDLSAFPGVGTVQGLASTDTVIGSAGTDVIRTGAGADRVEASDGAFDLIDCGAGANDVAVVDAIDRVSGCETVQLPVATTGPISGPSTIRSGRSGRFRFSSPTAGAVFSCRLDAGRWTSCASPYVVQATSALKRGSHTLSVRAQVPGAAPDATPSTKRFRVTR